MRPILLLLAVSSIAVSGCSNGPERPVTSRPPVADLEVVQWTPEVPAGVCTTEPPVPSEAELDADPMAGINWEAETLARGRACRDAHVRSCRWHSTRGESPLVCKGGLE